MEQWTQSGEGAPWAICPHAASNMCRASGISALGWPSLATRNVPATWIGYGHTLGDLHLSGTHSEQQHIVPRGQQRAGDLQFCFWAYSIDTRSPDEP